MRSKKSAFANTSTGYSRHKHSGHGKGHGHGHRDKSESGKSKEKECKDKNLHEQTDEKDKDLNSGFGEYLRTPEAFEMMKLFVFANTIMLIVTMAWPHIKEQFYMLTQCMVGPFMQGILLIGIICWYSKNMMSMINDYYRSEFQRKLQAVNAAAAAKETPLTVDNLMDYVRELDIKEQADQQTVEHALIKSVEVVELGHCNTLLRFMQITGAYAALDFCSAADSSIS